MNEPHRPIAEGEIPFRWYRGSDPIQPYSGPGHTESPRMTTWLKLLEKIDPPVDFAQGELHVDGEIIEGAEMMEHPALLHEFDDGLGGNHGTPGEDAAHYFLLWTPNYVYFPVGYDGAREVGSVPRNPPMDPTPAEPFGGGD